jgi:hypothetical protein
MTKSHSNEVKVKCSTITSVVYIDKSLVITSGQPSAPPPSISHSGDTWTITMECGRKGSGKVASQFTSTSGGVGKVISPTSMSDKSPDDLNFFFGVTVCFNVNNENFYTDIYLGQGHRSLRNNWWIGGENVAAQYNSMGIIVIPTIPSMEVNEVFSITGGISNFDLNRWIAPSDTPEKPKWMKSLPDAQLITDINLPGTHDSAAINTSIVTPYATQYLPISKQLIYGVRLLDVRLSIHKKSKGYEFITCHGDRGFGNKLHEYQPLISLLDECKTFLTANTSEFIAMSIKVDDWNGISASDKSKAYSALSKLLATYPTFSKSTIPSLGSSRGKIYLMNRMNTDLSLGVPINWTENTSGSLSSGRTNRSFQLYVQDKYEDLGSDSKTPEQEKYDLFVNAITKARSGQMLINFASGIQPVLRGVYIMDKVLKYFGSNDAGSRPSMIGWSLFDYIATGYSTNIYGKINVLQVIISSNFNYSDYPKKFIANQDPPPKDEL